MNAISQLSQAPKDNFVRKNIVPLTAALCTLFLSLTTATISSAHSNPERRGLVEQAREHRMPEKYVLDYQNLEIRSGFHNDGQLSLKRNLQEQYPWLDVRQLDLRSVVLVAKTKHGKGAAQLRVGNRVSDNVRIAGRPSAFFRDKRSTFDTVRFNNPDNDSRGPWQLILKGNFVVQKVILEVEDLPRHDHPLAFDHLYGFQPHR